MHFLSCYIIQSFETTCNLIRKSKLNFTHSRVVVEKPIGFNKQSAIEINENLYKTFKEEQIIELTII